ncbi:unnamed protein product [Effrenium voratum]|nr:unnamed protein product [Effrenium voratum]
MLALCPPPWANDCVMQQLPDVIEVFRDHIFPLSLMVTLRLYQSVFRFESKGLQSFQRAAEHLELLAKLNCHLGYQRCWQGRRLAWRRGVGTLCRALSKLRAESSLKFDRGTPRLCARMMQERGVKRASELELLLGLMEGVQVLAALLPAQSLPEFTSGSIREAQLQHGADCQEALEALELDKRRALAELPNLLAVPRATELLMRRTLGLLERLDRFAHSFPGEVRSMPFELLYPARLSPDGVCHAQRLPSILPPEQRWFRSNVDGTRYYGPWPSVGELLLRYAAAGGSLSRWVLNLGSGDGGCVRGDEYDPANCLALEGFRTVAVEADAALAAQAAARLAEGAAKARVKAEAVEPQTVGAELSREALLLLAEGSIPPGADWLHLAETARRPDLLKVDIDHADCEVLGALLQVFEPLLLHVEINPLFPPPFDYRERWSGKALPLETAHHLIGCSLQAVIHQTKRRWGARAVPEAYWLHHVEFENAVLVHPDAAGVFRFAPAPSRQSSEEVQELYLAGYFCHVLRSVLSMRENLAAYDFRSWIGHQNLSRRGARMHRFLQREWSKANVEGAAPYSLTWPAEKKWLLRQMSARLAELGSSERLSRAKREHARVQQHLDAETRLYQARLLEVLDSMAPLQRALGQADQERCDLAVQLVQTLVAISDEEATWAMTHRAQKMAHGAKDVKVFSETHKVWQRLKGSLGNYGGCPTSQENTSTWSVLHRRELLAITALRQEVTRLRSQVAAAEAGLGSAKRRPQAAAAEQETRAILHAVLRQAEKAREAMGSYGLWASQMEAALKEVSSHDLSESRCALPSMGKEAQRLRSCFAAMAQAARRQVQRAPKKARVETVSDTFGEETPLPPRPQSAEAGHVKRGEVIAARYRTG